VVVNRGRRDPGKDDEDYREHQEKSGLESGMAFFSALLDGLVVSHCGCADDRGGYCRIIAGSILL
jgi:hypothetical protein